MIDMGMIRHQPAQWVWIGVFSWYQKRAFSLLKVSDTEMVHNNHQKWGLKLCQNVVRIRRLWKPLVVFLYPDNMDSDY